ncbi:hypothetical protein TELCIR_04808 [Teladorsagia circumcincta]|uniref:Uncharacterized protein n=1 Tax=Teladorsagia circumcincta TaxID=45464 RepID=A0A2G9USV4_TELCI|nr:hypothetical protein TELCIR_04808 [Teladorsagia circumcincta]
MEQSKDQLTVPVNRPLHLNLNELTFTDPPERKPIYLEHSPVLSQKIKIPKKRYSYADPLERMDTPVFDKSKVSNVKKGPSSAATVLTMAGVFVVGILLIMSGMIVLIAIRFLRRHDTGVGGEWVSVGNLGNSSKSDEDIGRCCTTATRISIAPRCMMEQL